jgi:hypothetical protein
MSKIQRAINALNECADALDDIPPSLRTQSLLGFRIHTELLREEAEMLMALVDVVKEANNG